MKRFALAMVTLVVCAGAQAASEDVEMNLVTSQGVGQSIGTVKITKPIKGWNLLPISRLFHPANMVFTFMPKAAVNPQ